MKTIQRANSALWWCFLSYSNYTLWNVFRVNLFVELLSFNSEFIRRIFLKMAVQIFSFSVIGHCFSWQVIFIAMSLWYCSDRGFMVVRVWQSGSRIQQKFTQLQCSSRITTIHSQGFTGLYLARICLLREASQYQSCNKQFFLSILKIWDLGFGQNIA